MDWKLEVVVVPVRDVDRAKQFYSEGCGFHVDLDEEVSDGVRVVQLTPPGSACSVTIGTGMPMSECPIRGLQLVVADIDAARAQLVERGVAASEIFHFAAGEQRPGRGGRWNSFVSFSDPDGNEWVVQERPAGE